MNTMTQIVKFLKQQRIFQLFSSVKLAIPLLVIVAAAVAWGTIVESRYNSDLAKIVVYNSPWFSFLLVLLWLNIFCAAISRIPWKIGHLGFVTTHIGLLILLAGGMVTTTSGVDGILSVPEGQAESAVALSQLVVGLAPEGSQNYQTLEVIRTLKETTNLEYINEQFGKIFRVQKVIPFAQFQAHFEPSTENSDVAIGFILKSQFFNVSEFLHSRLNSRMQLGPATLELITSPKHSGSSKLKASKLQNGGKDKLKVFSGETGELLKEIAISDLRERKVIKVKSSDIEFKGIYRFASVSKGGVEENEGGKSNPAIELIIRGDGVSYKEVLFSKFPGFTLNKNPKPSLKFAFISADEVSAPDVEAPKSAGNTIQFRVLDLQNPKNIEVTLSKNGRVVLQKIAQSGETIQTPWMGIQLTIASVVPGAIPVDEVKAVEPLPGGNLPPSALLLAPQEGSNQSLWIPEGETRSIKVNDRSYSVYFGRKMFRLPFSLYLEKFSKIDYPGTETAMSFESTVKRSGANMPEKISMNEPLFADGFTVYQSSFQMGPGQPTISIFSVNRDPGRALKYWGSLILCLGIAIFTIMRSNVYRRWRGVEK